MQLFNRDKFGKLFEEIKYGGECFTISDKKNEGCRFGSLFSNCPLVARHKIEETFNKSELKELCSELSITYENLDGTTIKANVLSLLEYTQRHSMLEELVGKTVTIHIGAWSSPVRGEVVEISESWLKLQSKKTFEILNKNRITRISVLQR